MNELNIDYAKLLNRSEISIDNNKFGYLKDKNILVTGGCGSIGSEIVRQIIERVQPSRIIIYDNNECQYYNFKNELDNNNIHFILGDVRDKDKLEMIIKTYKVNIIYHAAAYKHVSILEYHPYESIKTNINSTVNLVNLALKYKILKFTYVSTDKAVNPTNVMGCCKRISENYINYICSKNNPQTHFIITRFGNVLGSSGSVIPTFLKRIKENKTLQVTHNEITRYFMSIPEAATLVILSSCICKNNEKILFDMGKPVKIIDLANNLLSYLNRLELGIEIVGLREGEKMYEELYYDNEIISFNKECKLFILKNDTPQHFINNLDTLEELLKITPYHTKFNIQTLMKILVPSYSF